MPSIRTLIYRAGWRFPGARLLSSRRPVALLYHGVPSADTPGRLSRAAFERHVEFLTRHFMIVAADAWDGSRGASDRPRVILTFDDGFRNNAEVVAPVLRAHGAPAVFFVSTRHVAPGKQLWFAYLQALERSFPKPTLSFRDETLAMDSARRAGSVRRLREMLLALSPHPRAMYDAIEDELPPLDEFIDRDELCDQWAGMTEKQIADLSADELFTIGAHTLDHAYLTRCEPAEMSRQIAGSKRRIEEITGRPCRTFAYPTGDYDMDVVAECRRLGFTSSFAVMPRFGREPAFEIPRVGVYAESLDALGFKVQWGNLMRGMGLKVG